MLSTMPVNLCFEGGNAMSKLYAGQEAKTLTKKGRSWNWEI